MKDIVIKGRDVRRELLIFAGCVVVMIILNIIAIHLYKTSWRELYSVWYAVLAGAVLLYIIVLLLRLLVRGLCRLFGCRRKK